ncbi:YciI family protein [Variovorax soli]|jgi:hypothetical protein|uniref:YciI family protein n=1 Tax=Variovorax soli TaxID=376815 RepID=UPI000837B66A|nr:YciI family protein [Variovorax soli]
MEYMVMFYETQEDFARRNGPQAQAQFASWVAYINAMQQAGVMRAGNGLQGPMTGTTLRVRGDKRQVQDGPFADTKEQLGGYVLLDVADLDAALEWAARAPCASTGGVELRPLFSPSKT